MTPAYQRGLQLFQRDRYEDAAKEFRLYLIEDPDDAHALSLLSMCLNELDQVEEATATAKLAISAAPDAGLGYFALGKSYVTRNRTAEARQAFREAVRLEPYSSSYHAMVAAVEMSEHKWQAGLEAADKGLEFEPEHATCLNLRSLALTQLGRRAEAAQAMRGALSNSPENSDTHANQGWADLHDSHPQTAMGHFREALRLDPGNEFARTGMVEALKARNVIYRLMLAFFLWMSRLSRQAQYAVLIAFIFLPNALRSLSKTYPILTTFIEPIQLLLLAFVLMTWIANPLFNLLLRFDRFGRFALSSDQIKGANLLAFLIFPFAACVVAAMAAPNPYSNLAIMGAWIFGTLMLPASQLFQCELGWPRTTMWVYFAVAALIGCVALNSVIILAMFGVDTGKPHWVRELDFRLPTMLAISLGILAYAGLKLSPILSWLLANWLTSAKVRR